MLGPDHQDLATRLNNRAGLFRIVFPHFFTPCLPHLFVIFQGKYDEAEALYKRSLAVREKVLDSDHPEVAQSLGN